MPRKDTPPPSEGARLLRLVAGSHFEIANRIGARSASTISGFSSGRRQPNAEMQEAMARELGIAPESWAEPAQDDAAQPVLQVSPVDRPLLDTLPETEQALLEVRRQQQQPDLSPATRARLASEVRALLRLRANLQALEEVTSDKLARSSVYQALASKLVDAVAPCERCSRELLAVLPNV